MEGSKEEEEEEADLIGFSFSPFGCSLLPPSPSLLLSTRSQLRLSSEANNADGRPRERDRTGRSQPNGAVGGHGYWGHLRRNSYWRGLHRVGFLVRLAGRGAQRTFRLN